MTLVHRSTKNTPNLDVIKGSFFGDFDRFFNDALTPFIQVANSKFTDYPANFYETDKNFVLELAVPGVNKKDIDISVEGRNLTVKGNYKEANEGKDEDRQYHVSNFRKGEFTRTITLPDQVDANKIAANVTDGILELQLPKAEAARARKISVN